jgi:RES domain-containing protein
VIYDRDLLKALELEAPTTALSAHVWRATIGSQPALRPNVRGARWNPPGTDCLYTSETADCASAELRNLVSVQPITPKGPYFLNEVEVKLDRVVDVRNKSLLARLGVDIDHLPDDESGHVPCQVIGGAAAFLGFEAMLVPSLRCDGASLAVFMSRLRIDLGSLVSLLRSDELKL